MKLLPRLLKPAALGNSLLLRMGPACPLLRLRPWKSDNHDCNCEHCKERNQRQERHGRQQEPGSLGLGPGLFPVRAPETARPRHCANIMFGPGPRASRRWALEALFFFHAALGAPEEVALQ